MTLRSNNSLKNGEMYYAIHPLSVTFARDYTNSFILYFEKDLAILSRFELCDKMISKDEKYYFQIPTQIQSLKFQNEKDLQFKWSLYIQRVTDNYQHEQYMESKKSNLRWCWEVFQRYQNRTNSVQVNFGVVRLRLTFLFIIGQTTEQLIRALQSYYKENNIIPTNKKLQQSRKNRFDMRKKYTLPDSMRNINDSNIFSEITEEHEVWKVHKESQLKQSAQIRSPLLKLTGRDSPLGLSKIDIDDLGATRRMDQMDMTKIKRTLSEVEITKDIQRMVVETEQYIRNTNKSTLSGSGNKNKIQKQDNQQFYQQQKWINQSQYLNKQGKLVVVPFYVQIKYWLIIILTIVIFIGLMYQGPRSKSYKIRQIQEHKNSKNHSKHKNNKNDKESNKRKSRNKNNIIEGK